MSRNTRAALAITAAVALLAGSGASFARWYDEKALSDANVTTGVLSIEQTPGSESWLINPPDSDDTADATVPFDPANDKIVPGDVVTYSSTFTLHLEGKNLRASAALLPEGLDTSVDGLSVSSEFDCGSANLAALTQADNGATCTAKATIVYEQGSKDNSTSAFPELRGNSTKEPHSEGWAKAPAEQGVAVEITGFKVVLEQNLRPAQVPFGG